MSEPREWTVLRDVTTTQVYRVMAESKREAIEAWMRGEGDLVDTIHGEWKVTAVGERPSTADLEVRAG